MNPSDVFATNPVVGRLYHMRANIPFSSSSSVKMVVCYLGNGEYLAAGSGKSMTYSGLCVFEPGVVEKSNNPNPTVWLEEVSVEEEEEEE